MRLKSVTIKDVKRSPILQFNVSLTPYTEINRDST